MRLCQPSCRAKRPLTDLYSVLRRQELHEALLERLASETHGAGCERKLMRVLIELRQLPAGLDARTVDTLWERSKTLIQARDPKVREKGLILSGEVVAAFLQRHMRKAAAGLIKPGTE